MIRNLFQSLRQHDKLDEALLLGCSTLFCMLLFALRFSISGNLGYLFLHWNLFLAFIPWGLTTGMFLFPVFRKNKIILISVAGLWLLFFPNAPYILTDLFHLRSRSVIPIWMDLILILSFAWTGLLAGFMSLLDMEELFKPIFGKRWVSLFVFLSLFLVGYGIYLGRFERWNSWDIVGQPFDLFERMAGQFLHPREHIGIWGMTIAMGALLNMMYFTLKVLKRRKAGL